MVCTMLDPRFKEYDFPGGAEMKDQALSVIKTAWSNFNHAQPIPAAPQTAGATTPGGGTAATPTAPAGSLSDLFSGQAFASPATVIVLEEDAPPQRDVLEEYLALPKVRAEQRWCVLFCVPQRDEGMYRRKLL